MGDNINRDYILLLKSDLGNLPRGGILSTSSLPLEDIHEEDPEDDDDLPQLPDPDLMSPDLLSPDVMSPDLMSPDSLASCPPSPIEDEKCVAKCVFMFFSPTSA